MKKLVVILSVLCFSLFVTTLKLESIFASNDSKVINVDKVEKIDSPNKVSDDINDEYLDINTSAENLVSDSDTKSNSSFDVKKDSLDTNAKVNDTYTNTSDSSKSDLDTNLSESTIESDDSNKNEINNNNETTQHNQDSQNNENVQNVISKDDALNILKSMNPDLNYDYKGDENTFTSLKDKGLSGYVFLPNIDTDLGYFIDKNTSHVYYFHPSGYLELIK